MSTSAGKSAAAANNKKSPPQRSYVPVSALAKKVDFADEMLRVTFTDGRILAAPLIWFPTLRAATAKERAKYEIGGGGISLHWPELDEDLSIAGLMAGVDQRSA